MKKINVLLAVAATFAVGAAASASPDMNVHRVVHRGPPPVASDPYWVPDYNVVPRYRYNPRDDKVDTSPYAKPIAPGDREPGPMGPNGQ